MFHVKRQTEVRVPAAARAVFGERYPAAVQYATMLAGPGSERGLIGPREVDRMWDRHLLNSAAITELIPAGARVLDVGSGAGLPGIPLALARPDLSVMLLDPMAKRVAWLEEVVAELELSAVRVYRGRVEDSAVRAAVGEWDIVTARAVAPLGRLASWCLPLVVPDGRLLAMKGSGAGEEIERDGDAVRSAGGAVIDIAQCGATFVEPPTTVVVVLRPAERVNRSAGTRRRKDQ